MPAITGILPHFAKGEKEASYRSLPEGSSPFRDSSDGSLRSDEGLLSEKEIAELRSKRPFLNRWWRAIAIHLIILAVYIGGLVATYRAGEKRGNIRGPNLVHCIKIATHFLIIWNSLTLNSSCP